MAVDAKQRSCSLWLCITQYGEETEYRIKTERANDCVVRRILSKHTQGEFQTRYVVEKKLNRQCTCTCPDWATKRRDCKHILALRANDLL